MSATQLQLSTERVNELVRLLTDSLVHLKDLDGTAIVTTPEGKVINQKEWTAWDWNQGVALAVLYNHSAARPSSSEAAYSLKTVLDWYELQWKQTDGKGAPKNINTMAPLYSISSYLLDGRVKDERWSAWAEEWAEWAMNGLARTKEGGFQHITYRVPNKDQLWDDTLFMTVVPLARIGVLLNRPEYIEEVKYQCLIHIHYLQDTVSGLWFHGWQFTEDGRGHNFARALWARGNSWITYAIPLLLEILDGHPNWKENDPTRRTLVSTYRRQVDALLECQDVGGLWHTILDDPTSYLEVSGTAGFAAGILMGVRTGLLDRAHYLPSAQKALAAILPNIQADGTVVNVSYGTPIGETIQFYKDIRLVPMPYGQGLTMAALVEWTRLQAADAAAAQK